VQTYGNLIHRFIERGDYRGFFLPGYRSLAAESVSGPWLLELDHVALSVPAGELDRIIELYVNTLDLKVTHEENIVTQYSAMNSKVVQNSSGTVRFPIMEPGLGQRKSQIEEFLKYNNGPGVQHLAFSCKDIIESVRTFRRSGAEFLVTPSAYYDMLSGRIGDLNRDVALLRELNILVDRDEWGYLLQIFSKPITGRPTLFFELIQREGARGFGSGNIRALFDAVEKEQRMRGNL
jgi:4-hydroxyphenylpyruvate dioxygenase